MSAQHADVRDPSSDPTASYALEPAFVRTLTDQVLATSGTSVPTYCPFNGQPLGSIPQSRAADVEEAFRRARRAQQQWARTSIDERQIRELATLTFVHEAGNVILLGPPGVGKTHLSVGLAIEAISGGHSAYFVSA